MQLQHTLAFANLLACTGIVYLCICQLNSPTCQRYRLARARFAILLTGAMASGLQPLLLGSWPTLGELALSTSVLAAMALQALRWHHAHHPHRRRSDL